MIIRRIFLVPKDTGLKERGDVDRGVEFLYVKCGPVVQGGV